jgi:Ca2+-binding RTX toxin-like protein
MKQTFIKGDHMATFTGTAASETISPTNVSPTVTSNPLGSLQSDVDDLLYGYGGDDFLSSGGGSDSLYGGIGNDTLYGGSGGDKLYGDAGNDYLYGEADNDYLNGGLGNDAMSGGTGDDSYVVDNALDIVFEEAGAGTDTVYAYVNYSLSGNAENLTLSGTASTGNGNILNNILKGNSYANTLDGREGNDYLYGYDGNDTLIGGVGYDNLYGGNGNDTLDGGLYNDLLDGGSGNDTMSGGLGNDTYAVDSALDVVSEAAGAGIDRVNAYVNYTLGDNIENLFLYGTAVNGTGNSLNNVIIGTSVRNILSGGDGNDTLTGY